MEYLVQVLSWGSPVGIGLFLFCLLVGMGVFFWGVSHLTKSDDKV